MRMPTLSIQPQPMPHPLDRDPGMPRHTPYMGQPDYRMYELNKRLQQRTEESDNLWWDAFATEFFEDDATLTLSFCLEDGPKRYTIGRTLIPRYFRSIFEGGVTDLYYNLKHPKESFHNTTITLDSDQATMVTHHGKPMLTKLHPSVGAYVRLYETGHKVARHQILMCGNENGKLYHYGRVSMERPMYDYVHTYMYSLHVVLIKMVVAEGRLILEFTFDDLMRIRSWHFAVRQHRELIPRSVIALQDPAMVEQLSKNITRQGLTNYTLNFLRLCVILEPMQELMSRHKAYGLNPRDCLKTTLFQKWQRMVAPPTKETGRPPSKRRKRKNSSTGSAAGNNANPRDSGMATGKQKRSPGPQGFNPVPGDVMVVGEPTLMGGEFGDEDERLITRLENQQFEPNGTDDDPSGRVSADAFRGSPAMAQGGWGSDKKPPQSGHGPPLGPDDIKQE